MKNKKFILITTIIAVMLIILLIVTSNNIKQNVMNNAINNSIKNDYENTAVNDNSEYEGGGEIEIEDDDSVPYQPSNNNTDTNVVIAIPANTRFKQILLNDTWLRSNIYLKEDCFENEIRNTVKQKLSFIKIDKEEYPAPVIVLKVECSEANSTQCYVLTYDNGEIKVTPLDEKSSHIGHVEYEVNSSSGILYKKTQYSNEKVYDIYSISANGISKICSISQTNQIVNNEIKYTYYYNGNECTESQYNNMKNAYVNEFIKKDTYKELNSDTVEKNF